jgi:hypothetical protein
MMPGPILYDRLLENIPMSKLICRYVNRAEIIHTNIKYSQTWADIEKIY